MLRLDAPHFSRLRLVRDLCGLLAITLVCSASAEASAELVVRFDDDASAAQRSAARSIADANVVRTLDGTSLQVIAANEPLQALRALRRNSSVRWAAIPRTAHVAGAPNDPGFTHQWALHNDGSAWGQATTLNADASFPEAWDARPDASNVLLGVVDSGLANGLADFSDGAWVNSAETPSNGLDDDGNGYVDDVRGWSTARNSANVNDATGHGTAVVSVAAADRDDGVGIAGASNATVIPADAFGGGSSTSMAYVDAGSRYVANHGARVVNLSLAAVGSMTRPVPDPWPIDSDLEIYRDFPETLFVVASGNDGLDLDASGSVSIPCELPLENILCVGASTADDDLASFSNYSSPGVDLLAPGQDVSALSTGGSPYAANGTSFAAPLTSAAATLVAASRPDLGGSGIRQAVIQGDVVPSLANLTLTDTRLSANGAVLATSLSPAPSATGLPVIAGSARVGQTLTATPPTYAGSVEALEYRWDRCKPGGACQRIAGAYSSSYAVTSADTGKALRSTVVAHVGDASSFTRSALSGVVPGSGGSGGGESGQGPTSPAPSPTPPRQTPAPATAPVDPPRRMPQDDSSRTPIVSPVTRAVLRGTRPTLKLTCTRPAGCARTAVRVSASGVVLARATMKKARGAQSLRLRLTPSGRRRTAKRWPLRVTVTIEVGYSVQKFSLRTR